LLQLNLDLIPRQFNEIQVLGAWQPPARVNSLLSPAQASAFSRGKKL
jgi:hypothetical protein